ncbi:MAG: ABC transporter permease [Rhodospirillaceae bacterium]|nr:ABC transporter permease [Rhodospirillaceae bacterium]
MNFELMGDSILPILRGAQITVMLVATSIAIGFFAGIGMALARLSRNPLVSVPAYAYVFFFRGTPLLVQLFIVYYGFGRADFVKDTVFWAVLKEPFWCAVIALTLNTTAYTSEIIRGGILAVPWGQIEAARACGMSRVLMFRRITMPVAIRQALPAYGNEIILMVKGSALASTVTVMEMTGEAKSIISSTYAPVEIFIVAGSIYLAINFVVTRAVRRLEHRLTPYQRARTEADEKQAGRKIAFAALRGRQAADDIALPQPSSDRPQD